MHVVRRDHLNEVFHLLPHEVVDVLLWGRGVLHSFIQGLFKFTDLVVEVLSVHVLPEELHHALEAKGDKDLVVSLLDCVANLAHDLSEAQQRPRTVVDVLEVLHCKRLIVKHVPDYVWVDFDTIFFKQLV